VKSHGQSRELVQIAQRFSQARVLVLGDLVADEYVFGETERISREAPVLIVRYERSETRPGCAANAAANLCALGARVRPVGLIGDDASGQRLREALRNLGADDKGLLVGKGLATASKTRILAGGKNTRRQQMLRVDRDGPGAPDPALLDKLLHEVRRAASRADAVLVSDYGGGTVSRPLRALLAELAQQGKLVCVDARYDLSEYRGVTVAKPNEVELEVAVGRKVGEDPRALEDAGRELLSRLRAQALLVTRGRLGMALLRPGEATALLPAHGAKEAVDVTGAGDTVMAAFTLAMACGADALQAARLANVAGSIVVQKSGTATASVEELLAELRRAPVEEPALLPLRSGARVHRLPSRGRP
jgi:rfaE bifunctional protein kinase chain/domain